MSETEHVTLADCPPGLFLFDGRLGFKTEYGHIAGKDMGGGKVEWTMTNRPDAYVAASGEAFWGGAKTAAERDALMVRPLGDLIVSRCPSCGVVDGLEAHAVDCACQPMSPEDSAAFEAAAASRDVSYEVWQDEMPVAEADRLTDAMHYAAMYGQDGPVELVELTRRTIDLAALPDAPVPAKDGEGEG